MADRVIRLLVEITWRGQEGDRAPYYEDHELAGMAETWITAALEDRDDVPRAKIIELLDRGPRNHE